MTDENRTWSRPVEEVARALLQAKGPSGAAGVHWESLLQSYRAMCEVHPQYADGHNLVADAMRESEAALTRLISLGFINENGIEAMKAEKEQEKVK